MVLKLVIIFHYRPRKFLEKSWKSSELQVIPSLSARTSSTKPVPSFLLYSNHFITFHFFLSDHHMGLKTIAKNNKRTIRFHQYDHQGKKVKQPKKQKVMTISYTLKQSDNSNTTTNNVTRSEHNYSMQLLPKQRAGKLTKKSNEHYIICEIGKILLHEAEKVKSIERQLGENYNKFDVDSLQSFHEYAGYLDLVNPICSPDSVDTADKLVLNLGI